MGEPLARDRAPLMRHRARRSLLAVLADQL
jgi:hypothetical protein